MNIYNSYHLEGIMKYCMESACDHGHSFKVDFIFEHFNTRAMQLESYCSHKSLNDI